jgi:tetratricopeptide (TPR) repeat protein
MTSSPTTQSGGDPAAALDQMLSAAESRLAAGEIDAAERQYRVVLFEGWLLMARLERLAGDVPEARKSLAKASRVIPQDAGAAVALASAQLEFGEAAQAVATLNEHGNKDATDVGTVRLFVRALAMAGQEEQAVQKLDQAVGAVSGDPEVAFVLATDYLWLRRVEVADRLLAQVVAYRPVAETHVLVARAYRDMGEYDRARQQLQQALKKDPSVRRAHYYLGTLALGDPAAEGDRVQKAIAEFREELRIANEDPLVLDQLGMALIEAGRPEEAVSALERAVRLEPRATYFDHLGRAQIAAGRPAAAVESLRRALDVAGAYGETHSELETVHYRLGTALRTLGAGHEQEASEHFAEARRLAAHWTDNTQQLTALETGPVGRSREAASLTPSVETPPVGYRSLAQRRTLEAHVRSALARSYLNLGVIRTRLQQFAQAAELFEAAASVDPQLPGVQYALGVSRFNAGGFAGAAAPLAQAVAQDAGNRVARRLLAMVSINGELYAEAIDLLQNDPDLKADPAIEMALGIALAHGDRSAEAEAIFVRLLREHDPSPPLFVGLGWALAYQGRFEPATAAVSKAMALNSSAPEGRSVLGFIQLRTGRLVEAEESLRADLVAHPEQVVSQRLLAAVLLARGRGDEAIPLLRAIVEAWPDAPDARLRLSEAYTKLGKTELAKEQMEAYRRLAKKRLGENRWP